MRELDELYRNIENLRRRVEAQDSEATRIPSHDDERQPIPAYYGKRNDLSACLPFFQLGRFPERESSTDK